MNKNIHVSPVLSPWGILVGLAPQTKLQATPNWNMKHYKSVEFFSIFRLSSPLQNCKAPCRNAKPPRRNVKPSLKTSWRRFCMSPHWLGEPSLLNACLNISIYAYNIRLIKFSTKWYLKNIELSWQLALYVSNIVNGTFRLLRILISYWYLLPKLSHLHIGGHA